MDEIEAQDGALAAYGTNTVENFQRAAQYVDRLLGEVANRAPAPDEVETCTPYLVRQIEIIRPKVIITLGLPASKYMLSSNSTMGRLRGQWHEWRGIKLMPTFHPAYLLRSYTVENRQAVWSDLQKVMDEIGLKGKKRAVQEPV